MDKITHSLQWFKKVIIDIFITRLKSSIICVGLKELYSKPIFASEGQNREDIHKINPARKYQTFEITYRPGKPLSITHKGVLIYLTRFN